MNYLAEQVADLMANWDGRRCAHGMPIDAPGPDLICDRCEMEADAAEDLRRVQDRLDRGEDYGFVIGPRDPRPRVWTGVNEAGEELPF